jgi:hypothetical protein
MRILPFVRLPVAGLSFVVGGLLSAAQPALAAPADFPACDGYPRPSGKGDGITTESFLFGLAKGNADLRPSAFVPSGLVGAQACDAALADPLLQPGFAFRRISLVQAKAVHLISARRSDEALAVLDSARALPLDTAPDLRARGLDLANDALRAYALVELGRREEALALASRIEAARGYSPSVLAVAGALRSRLAPGYATFIELAGRYAPQIPSKALVAQYQAARYGKFEDGLRFGAGLTFALPRMRGNWRLEGGGLDDYDLILFRAVSAGLQAYMLSAGGQDDAANARLLAARAEVAEAATPPPTPDAHAIVPKSVMADYYRRKEQADKAGAELDRAEKLIALRAFAPRMQPDELFAALDKYPKGSVAVVYDLVSRLPAVGPADVQAKAGFLSGLRNAIDEGLLKDEQADLGEFVKLLPRAETPGNQARFHVSGDGYFLSDNGFSTRRMDDEDEHWTVRFTTALATPASVEELAVLSAAQLARKRGFDSFLIESRRQLERTSHVATGYMGITFGSQDVNSGREAQMTVWLFNEGQAPTAIKGTEWRALKADRVIADILAQHPEARPTARG